MRATITVDLENAAFEDPARELARILEETVERLRHYGFPAGLEVPLRDLNGNTVGAFTVSRASAEAE